MSFREHAKFARDVLKSLRGVTVGDVHFQMPYGISPTISELWMRDVIGRLLGVTEGAFVDVGVNLGQTMMCLRSLDRERQYLGFEPNVDCVAAARRIVELNYLLRTEIIPVACATRFTVSKLFHYEDSLFDSSASMVENFRPNTAQGRVSYISTAPASECLRVAGIGRLGIVKIDVEGFEADVIEALEPQLLQDGPAVLVEVLPTGLSTERIARRDRISALLKRISYQSLQIKKSGSSRFDGIDTEIKLGSQSNEIGSDYLLLPRSWKDLSFLG